MSLALGRNAGVHLNVDIAPLAQKGIARGVKNFARADAGLSED
jgi:hypothetical protein